MNAGARCVGVFAFTRARAVRVAGLRVRVGVLVLVPALFDLGVIDGGGLLVGVLVRVLVLVVVCVGVRVGVLVLVGVRVGRGVIEAGRGVGD